MLLLRLLVVVPILALRLVRLLTPLQLKLRLLGLLPLLRERLAEALRLLVRLDRRLAKKGRDPFLARVTTICTGGQYVHKLVDPTTDPPTVVEERLEPEAVLHLRSAGADYEYVFPDSELKGTKNDILGMGVSLVIGSAALS